MDSTDLEPRATGPAAAVARLQTGAKLFLILVVALLPLALIALFTTIQTTQLASNETRERLRAMAEESSATVQTVLSGQISGLTQTLAALEANPADTAACERLSADFDSENPEIGRAHV